MSKFLYMQDFHISGKNSIHYISNYFEDCLLMLNEILSIAKKNKVDAMLDGGDLFDTPMPSYRVLDEFCDRIEKAKIPLLCLYGNHSMQFHSVEHAQYTGLSHLIKRSKYITYFGEGEDSVLHDNGKSYTITGIDYYHDLEENLKKNGLKLKGGKDEWKIALVHGFLTPTPFLPQVMHVCVDDIKTNADLVLVSHYHKAWDKTVDNTRYLDIGSVGRRSITEKDIIPSVLLLDTDKRSADIIKLKSAKSAEIIFDLSKLDEKREFNADIDKFIKSIESAEFQATNIKDTIIYIGKEKNVDKEVTDLILDKIKELQNE